MGSIAGNNYIPGALIRPAWDGQASGLLWVFTTLVSTFSSVAMRDVRVRPTKIVKKLYKLLEFAPASGLDGVLGDKAKDGRVQACSNSTFWEKSAVNSIQQTKSLSQVSGVVAVIRPIPKQILT